MPATQRTLSNKQWLDLIDRRQKLIKPHLDHFTLRTMLDMKCLKLGDEMRTLSTSRLPLMPLRSSEQGIFGLSERIADESTATCRNFHFYIWGLLRDGKTWVMWRVDAKDEYWPGPGQKPSWWEEALTRAPVFNYAEPNMISLTSGVNLESIWLRLGDAALEWKANRLKLYEQANAIADQALADEKPVEVILGRRFREPEPVSST